MASFSTNFATHAASDLLLWFKDGSDLWNLTSSGASVPGAYTIHSHIYTIYVHIHTKVKYCALSLEYSPSAKSET